MNSTGALRRRLDQEGIVVSGSRREFPREKGKSGESNLDWDRSQLSLSLLHEGTEIARAHRRQYLLALLDTFSVEFLGDFKGLFKQQVAYAQISGRNERLYRGSLKGRTIAQEENNRGFQQDHSQKRPDKPRRRRTSHGGIFTSAGRQILTSILNPSGEQCPSSFCLMETKNSRCLFIPSRRASWG